jgi:hypothetical protein
MSFTVVLFFCRCTIGFAVVLFFAVVLISCMIPTYNFAVLPSFSQLYIIWFAVVHLFLQLYKFIFAVVQFTLRRNFLFFRTALKHTVSHVILLTNKRSWLPYLNCQQWWQESKEAAGILRSPIASLCALLPSAVGCVGNIVDPVPIKGGGSREKGATNSVGHSLLAWGVHNKW